MSNHVEKENKSYYTVFVLRKERKKEILKEEIKRTKKGKERVKRNKEETCINRGKDKNQGRTEGRQIKEKYNQQKCRERKKRKKERWKCSEI
jgi:hypothetical protein